MKKACMKKGSSVWTLTYVINEDNTMTVQNFDSQDNDGYMFADRLGTLDYIKEDDNRVAEEISVDGVVYKVSNPQNVFSYKQPL